MIQENCSYQLNLVFRFLILPRPAVSKILILVKLKHDHAYFEPVRPHTIDQALTYLKSNNKSYEDISVTKGPSGEDMLNSSDIIEIQEETESVNENGISDEKEMNKNNNKMQVKQNKFQLKIP